MHKFKLNRMLGMLMLIVGLMLFQGHARAAAKQQKKIPVLTLKNLSGKPVALKDYRGKVVLINIWATWCGPCRHEIPDLVKLRLKYREKGFEVLGIVVSSGKSDVEKMVKEFKIDYPVLWGTYQLMEQFGMINAIPRSFVLNKKGEIVEDITGSTDYAHFEKMISAYLK